MEHLGSVGVGQALEQRILAVVVAFNSHESIVRCLRSLHEQTLPVDVLVVDNSDPDPLALDLESLGFSRTQVIWARENLGPAGGFAFGLAWFMEAGQYSHAWVMDDDNYPDPNVGELLLKRSLELRPGVAVFPSVLNENTGELINYPSWCGVLIDRMAVALGGLPKPELFWWAEDTEYLQHRLPRKGVIVTRVDEAVVRDDRVRRVGGRPAWKYYYEVRNMVWYRLWEQRGSQLLRLPRTLVRMLGSALLSKDRISKTSMYAKGLAHGLIGRLGRDVRPPVQATDAPEASDHAT